MAGKSLRDSLAFSLTFEGISLKFRNPPGSPWPNFFLPDSPGSPGSPEKWQPCSNDELIRPEGQVVPPPSILVLNTQPTIKRARTIS